MEFSKSGFTILEITISMAILVLIGALAFVSFINSRNIRDLNTQGKDVLSLLRLAQARSLAGDQNSTWGVHFEQTRAVLFYGTSFAGGTQVETKTLSGALEIVNISLLGGGSDAIFNRVTGATDEAGTLDLRIRGSNTIFSITVETSGKVYQTGTAPVSLGTRVIDTRHRNFNLSGTIKNSTTMTLTFADPPNPDVVSAITMSPAPPRTSFAWTGSTDVGGWTQTLQIHALSITDSSTLLSVDRDCRKNNRSVKISFGSSDVTTFSADCQTVTIWPFGGTMVEP